MYVVLCCCLCDKRKEHGRHYNPRFTGPFTIRVPEGNNWEPSPEEHAAGQRVAPDPSRPKGKVVMRLWTHDGVCNKVPHAAGQPMLTWQVLHENRFVVSYEMSAHPDYGQVGTFLLEGRDHVRSPRLFNC